MPKLSTRNRRDIQKNKRRTRRKSGKNSCCVKELKDGNVRVSHNGQTYTTQNFQVCPSSVFALKQVAIEKPSKCLTFAKMEDRFLGYEIEAVCGYKLFGKCLLGRESYEKMRKLDAHMNSLFGSDLLGYHKMHLTTALQCVGPSPVSNMSIKALGCKQSGGANPGEAVSSWATKGSVRQKNVYMNLQNDLPQGPAQIKFQTAIKVPLRGQTAKEVLLKAVEATKAYFDLIKADTSERGLYRRMCMLPEVRAYTSYIENAKSPSKQVRMSEIAKLKEIKNQLEDGLAGTTIIADSCSRILNASSAQRPVDVKKEVEPATSEEIQQAAQSAVQAAVQGAVEKATSEIEKKQEEALQQIQAKEASALKAESLESVASEAETVAVGGPSSPQATKQKTSYTEEQEPKAEPSEVGLAQTLPLPSKPTTSSSLTESSPAALPTQEPKVVKAEPGLSKTVPVETKPMSEVKPLTLSAPAYLPSQSEESVEPELTESDKCPSQSINVTEKTCDRSEDDKRIIKTLLSPEANSGCEDKGKAAADKLAEFIRLCEKSTADAASPEQQLPSPPESHPEPKDELPTFPSAPTTVPTVPSRTPPSPITEERGCPVVRVQVGQWMCDLRGDELKTMLENLSKESNPNCPDVAAQKREEFEKLCPNLMTTLQEDEVKPQAPSQQEPPALPQPATIPKNSVQTELQTQPEAGVSTSMETIPKDGYNEVHIVVKVPSKYEQVATGTTGTTFATAIKSLTQRRKGGAKSHRAPITPKRKNRNISKLLNRKSLKHR